MTAFPTYESGALEALDSQAAAILGRFVARGYVREEPSILQPASLFLDRSGEEIRHRTFTLTDLSGRELCLRPDLTIPICRSAVERGARFPARICYSGLAFRYQTSGRPTQFFQAGVELLGGEDGEAAETEIMTLAVDALRAAGVGGFDVLIGDLGLFGAVVDALDLPAAWRARLKRHFWRGDYFASLLARLTQGSAGRPLPATRAEIDAALAEVADAPDGGRTREEIAARALEQAAAAAGTHLDAKIADVITRLLAVSGPVKSALGEIRSLIEGVGLRLDTPLAAMEARVAALAALGISPDRVRFAAHFGRNMEYYTGFVFELWSRDAEGPVQLAGGGRYDTLLEALGAGRAIPAIGCAIRTERVLAARAFGGRRLMGALTLAVPSKGRLQENAAKFFAGAGVPLEKTAGARGYRGTLGGMPDIEVLLLSASEIAGALLAGDVHLGITGEDLLRDAAPELERRVHLVRGLGFGFADVVVAVPKSWIDVSTMADLDDVCAQFAHRHRRRLRIATKYGGLTRAFFAHAGISDYRIVESNGATEGAPAAGSAEAIVDITTTGATLAANGLKTLADGIILKSQAQLAAALDADWTAEARAACGKLLAKLGGDCLALAAAAGETWR